MTWGSSFRTTPGLTLRKESWGMGIRPGRIR